MRNPAWGVRLLNTGRLLRSMGEPMGLEHRVFFSSSVPSRLPPSASSLDWWPWLYDCSCAVIASEVLGKYTSHLSQWRNFASSSLCLDPCLCWRIESEHFLTRIWHTVHNHFSLSRMCVPLPWVFRSLAVLFCSWFFAHAIEAFPITLDELGFTLEVARHALEACAGDWHLAVNMLINNNWISWIRSWMLCFCFIEV